LNLLLRELQLLEDETRDVAVWPRQVGDVSSFQRIKIDSDHDDGYKPGRAHDRLQRYFRPCADDQIRRRAHQIHDGNERTARIVATYVVDCHILSAAKPEARELHTEGLVLVDGRRAVETRSEESEPNGPSGLLRARRERQCNRRAAEQRHELAAGAHSITSSARASSVGEMSMPNALAVLRLMINSQRVACSMGRSAGFAPLKILSTKAAARRQM